MLIHWIMVHWWNMRKIGHTMAMSIWTIQKILGCVNLFKTCLQWILRRISLFCSILKLNYFWHAMLCQPLERAGIYNQAFRQAVLPDKASQKYPSIHLAKQRYLLFFPNILTSRPVCLLRRIKNILIPLFGQTDIFAVFSFTRFANIWTELLRSRKRGHSSSWWRSSSWANAMQCNVEDCILVRLKRLVEYLFMFFFFFTFDFKTCKA